MKIQVAGPGCPRCKETHQNVMNALAELDYPADVEYINDITKITQLGVMKTPAVIIDGIIVVSGKIPSVMELKSIIASKKKE